MACTWRNLLLNPPLVKGDAFVFEGTNHTRIFQVFRTYELLGTDGNDFVIVRELWQDPETPNHCVIRGLLLRRQKSRLFDYMLPTHNHELVLVIRTDRDDPRDYSKQSMETYTPEQLGSERTVKVTHSLYDNRGPRSKGTLYCRWIYETSYASASDRLLVEIRGMKLHHLVQYNIRHVRQDDHRPALGFFLPASAWDYRKSTVARAIDREAFQTKFGTQIKCVDAFCGCGGVSKAMEAEGGRIHLGIDYDRDCCLSYKVNFPLAEILNDSIENLLHHRVKFQPDIMHFSPPCQFFSPAHTHNGPLDEVNSAALFAIEPIIGKLRPKAVTLEQTAGLFTGTNHKLYFQRLIGMFVDKGYSVRWGVFDLREYGLAARRLRLVVFAAREDMNLPSFPAPTNGPRCRSNPHFKTVYQALSKIPSGATLHNLSTVARGDKASYSAMEPLNTCITTGGPEKTWHYSGLRQYTIREILRLQGAPDDFRCVGNKTSITRQAGNMVPTEPWRLFFREVRNAVLDCYLSKHKSSSRVRRNASEEASPSKRRESLEVKGTSEGVRAVKAVKTFEAVSSTSNYRQASLEDDVNLKMVIDLT